MFLHLGADKVIPLKSVIAILDLKLTRTMGNNNFIKKKQKENKVIDISDGNAKTFVIADDGVYLSTISALTLGKRAKSIHESEE